MIRSLRSVWLVLKTIQMLIKVLKKTTVEIIFRSAPKIFELSYQNPQLLEYMSDRNGYSELNPCVIEQNEGRLSLDRKAK
jgi:hypothetical protein